MPMRLRNLLVYCLSLLAASSAHLCGQGEPRPLWGGLEPGEHGVGYTSSWSVDPGRTYRRAGIDSSDSARPVLVNAWYPAPKGSGPPMEHGGYLRLADFGPIGGLAGELAEYARGIIAEEVFGGPPDALEAGARERLEALLRAPTAAVRDAPRAEGPFPLVLYHAGYGSSFEDNAVLCEYLASHGYLVLGSAFLRADGSSLNIDGQEDSARDLEHLIREACSAWGADRRRIGLVGHSGGAHAGIRFIARPNCAARALVSLDTTQDYQSFQDHRWDDFVPRALESAPDIDIPIMFVARQHAMFRMADRLDRSDRLYLTFRDLDHNSLIAHGVFAAEMSPAPGAGAIRAGYNELCRAILLFFDAELKGSPEARNALGERWKGAEFGLAPVAAEFVRPGVGAPPPYDAGAGRPPTPRQVAAALDAGDSQLLTDALEEFAEDPRADPLRQEELAMSAVFQLVHEQRVGEARRVVGCYPAKEDIVRLFGALGAMYAGRGSGDTGARFEAVVRALEEPRSGGEP